MNLLFDFFDKKSNREISYEEMKSIWEDYTSPNEVISLRNKMKNLLKNKNFDEGQKVRENLQDIDEFIRIDSNRDDYIIDVELMNAYKSNDTEITSEEVDLLIESIDLDGDNKLNIYEFDS